MHYSNPLVTYRTAERHPLTRFFLLLPTYLFYQYIFEEYEEHMKNLVLNFQIIDLKR